MQPTNTNPRGPRRSFLPTLLLLPLAVPAAAQIDVPVTDEATQADDAEDRKALSRIVLLSSGTSVRGIVRRGDDGWELKQSGSWTRLPLAVVEKVTLEKDALKEWKTRWKAAKKEGLDGKAKLGAWSLDNGLLEEGLASLERVLEDHGDHPLALTALGNHNHRFSLPRVDPQAEDAAQATSELRQWAATGGLTSREFAILELARLRDRDGLREVLADDLFVGSFRKRAFAAHALRRLYPGHEVEKLVHRAVLDGSEEVREQAAYGLRETGEVGVIVPVARALESYHPKVRSQAAQALGNMGYPAAVEPLMRRLSTAASAAGHNVPHSHIFIGTQFAYIQDFNVEVAQFQAVADPEVNVLIEGAVLDAGVHGVEEVIYASESRAIRTSLKQLTGADPGNSNRAWLRWWEENQDQWRTANLADKPPVVPPSK